MVAATERNIQLQESLFEVADKFDGLQSKLDAYLRCQEQTTMMIGVVIITGHVNYLIR